MTEQPDLQFWNVSNELTRFLQSDAEAVLQNYQETLEGKIKHHTLLGESEQARNLEMLLAEIISQRERLLQLSLILVERGMKPYSEKTESKPH